MINDTEIIIIDYGMGNLLSIKNIIKKCGGKAVITNRIDEIKRAKKIILPGVGSFDKGMENLKNLNLIELIKEKALIEKIPIMGICLGMQLLTDYSEEGNVKGLELIRGKTIKFSFKNNLLKVPHMGWSEISIQKKEHPIFNNIKSVQRFYFVHSYYVKCNFERNILAKTKYKHHFNSAIVNENIFGFQFHPEKSHKFGMNIIRNFIKYF